jgi:hypothetical protein
MSGPNTSKTSQEQRQAPGASSSLSEQPALSGSWDALLALQNAAGNRAVGRLLRDGAAGSEGDGAGRNGGPGAGANRAPVSIQRKPADGHENSQAELQSDQAAEKAVESQEAVATARPLIVEDNVTRLEQGQMRKSDFLDQLHTSVCGAAEQALAGTMWSAMGCPYIDRWFSHYSGQNSQYVERALRKYAPETAGAGSARDYISIVTERVRRGVGQWKETGETTGVPEELAQGGMPGMTATGLIGGLVGGALSAVGGAVSGLVSGAGQAISGIGRMLFKEREGGAIQAGDPETIQSQLGPGHSLDGGVKTRMESAFSADFSRVRIHTDAKARELSGGLNARAFTLGDNIAFGDGEYQPGDMVGEALIAHELAHVLQQGGSSSSTAPMQKGGASYGALEEEADISAVGVMAKLWGGAKGALTDIGRNASPRLRSGLRLQQCGGSTQKARSAQDIQREFDTTRRQILSGVPEGSEISKQLEMDLADLMNAYESELADAGDNASQQAQIQQRLLDGLQRMRETVSLQVEMNKRYGIIFTARSTSYIEKGKAQIRHRAWSQEELKAIDAALQKVPSDYLQNIRFIERNPRILDVSTTSGEKESTPPPHAAASWNQKDRKVEIYDLFFQRPEYERPGFLLHEIGHSTVASREPTQTGGFTSLPPQEWMDLSGWQTSTRQTLEKDLGISGKELAQLLESLAERKRSQRDGPEPLEVNGRMVVYDKYEGRWESPPTRFLHYASAHRNTFVSRYAQTHPAEDLAESFSRYLHDPKITLIQDSARSKMGEAKWRYLEQRYPQKLR